MNRPRIGDHVHAPDADAVGTITRLFDIDGEDTNNPEEAVSFVATLPDGRWFAGSYSRIDTRKLH